MKIFQTFGCEYKRKEGSDHILSYPGAKRAVVIPEYDEIDVEIISVEVKLNSVYLCLSVVFDNSFDFNKRQI